MKIGQNETLLFIGDSITDCGRARPVGRGNGLGNGYVNMVNALLTARYPERRVRVLNTGIGGNTVLHLEQRWQADVLDLRPTWLSVMIGINDVWRQFDNPLESDMHVLPHLYETTLRKLVTQAQPWKGLVLMAPYFIESSLDDDMRQMMDCYGQLVKRIAESTGAIFVDTQAAFDKVLGNVPSEAIAGDRVHPGAVGHMIIARAFLEAIGFEW